MFSNITACHLRHLPSFVNNNLIQSRACCFPMPTLLSDNIKSRFYSLTTFWTFSRNVFSHKKKPYQASNQEKRGVSSLLVPTTRKTFCWGRTTATWCVLDYFSKQFVDNSHIQKLRMLSWRVHCELLRSN